VRAGDLWKFALLGILGAAGSNFTYYYAIQETNVRTAILLQYMAPLMVLGWAAATGEEKLSAVKVAAVIVSVGGCFLAVSGTDLSVLSISPAGLVSGIGAAVFWAFTNVWLKRLLVSYAAWTCILWAFISATLFWLVINPPWVFLAQGYGAEEWGVLAAIAVTSVLIPHSLYYTGMKYLTSTRAMITAAAEPVIAIASAWLVLGEPLGPWQAAGAAAVLGAIGLLQTSREENGTVPEANRTDD
jgi:drug/metabolite transporter (DMT)-like permease